MALVMPLVRRALPAGSRLNDVATAVGSDGAHAGEVMVAKATAA